MSEGQVRERVLAKTRVVIYRIVINLPNALALIRPTATFSRGAKGI
jgi:hypothetical protein